MLREHYIKDTQRILVAVSGGADSVALLRALAEWSPSRLLAMYVDHRLRPEAEAEARFVEETATRLGAGFTRAEVDTREIQRARKRGVEEAARAGRYEALLRVATEQKIEVVATGHTANDQAETVLWRLVRGGALASLSGMQEARALGPGVSLVRPMLQIERGVLLGYLHKHQQGFLEDASNGSLEFTRNRLRHLVMPLLERENPEVVGALGLLAREVAQSEGVLAEQASRALGRVLKERLAEGVVLSVGAMRAESPALQERVLGAVLPERYLSRGQVGSLLRLLRSEGGKSVRLEGITATRQKDRLVLQWET